MQKDSYLIEKDLVHFRRATKEDNLSQIAELIYNTDPYIYPYWFDNDEDKCKEFFKEAILQEGFLFHYDNLYVAHDITTNEIIGVICAIACILLKNIRQEFLIPTRLAGIVLIFSILFIVINPLFYPP